MKTYSILLARINESKTKEELEECEKQITRHYDNATINARELTRLDVKIMEKQVILIVANG